VGIGGICSGGGGKCHWSLSPHRPVRSVGGEVHWLKQASEERMQELKLF